jgi:hypothetical protein
MPTFEGDPIFVGGDGRSGTTLLSLILDSHPDLTVGPELHFNGPDNLGPYVLSCLELLKTNDPRASGKGLKENPELKRGVQFAKRCHRFGVSFDELATLVRNEMEVSRSDLSKFEDRCRLINSIGELRRAQTRARRWGIKIMRDIGRVGQYEKLWPKAQFLHIVRDGRDVAASQMTEHGKWGYGDIQAAARGWVELIQKARRNNGSSVIELRYEDIVMDSESTLRTLLDSLGVAWSDQVLRHTEVSHSLFENPYNHPSIKSIVNPINTNAVGRYARDLSQQQIQAFESIAVGTLREFGYRMNDSSTAE